AIKDDVRGFNERIVQETIENNRSMKKVKRQLALGRKQILAVQKEDGTTTCNRQTIMKIVTNYFTNLYKKTENVEEEEQDVNQNTQEIPSVLPEEVMAVIKQMKNGKAGGADGVLAEYLKIGGEEITSILAQLFTNCLRQGRIPKEWNHARIALLHKKGSKEDLKNYRPISLLPVVYKTFMRVLAERLKLTLAAAQPREQAGFRKGFSTMDHIHTLQEIINRTNEYEMPLAMCFVDYAQAFDSVSTSSILGALRRQGINEEYVRLLQSIYK
ncbi:TPA: reverse transcriptase family protein, partial [Staphylococcus aureus]|nr:reverse transcriptase family protein [Staphylococcus aureus]